MNNNIKAREALLKSVSGLSDEQLNKEVEEGKWTIAQVLEHLYLLEVDATRVIQETLLNNENNPTKSKPVHLAVDRSHKVKAIEEWVPSNAYQTLENLKQKLTNSRDALVKSIQEVSEEDLDQKSLPHPAFGSLSINQWVSFIGYHEQRHIGQIEEIKEALESYNF
ncbi:DinB family protein [Rummeliibacillus pycnus]|uniref:DinB family protein n=1 Tax=Rummeliibacillus pycnus TaxID=101070 RepID=UPI003D2B1A13